MNKPSLFRAFLHGPAVLFGVACPRPEKLFELECIYILFHKLRENVVQIICKYFEFGHILIRIVIAEVQLRPLLLRPLLHDVIPSEDLVLIVPRKQLERRARQFEYLRLFVFVRRHHRLNDPLSERCRRAFMRLVDDHKVPIEQENEFVLVKFAANRARPPQILQRRKIDVFLVRVHKIFNLFPLCLGPENIVGVIKNFIEIIVPPVLYVGSVRIDQRLLKTHFFDDFKRSQRFAETHFCIPKHPVSFFEMVYCFLYCICLFGTENNRTFPFAYIGRQQRRTPFLDSGDRLFRRLQIALEPFFPLDFRTETHNLDV